MNKFPGLLKISSTFVSHSNASCVEPFPVIPADKRNQAEWLVVHLLMGACSINRINTFVRHLQASEHMAACLEPVASASSASHLQWRPLGVTDML